MTRHTPDREAADLLRRTFAAHDDVDPAQGARLMGAARAVRSVSPRPHRLVPALAGLVAASLLVAAVVVGGAVTGWFGHDPRPATPAVSGAATRLLTDAEREELLGRIDAAVESAGTMSMTMTYPSTGPTPTTAAPLPSVALRIELDARERTHRLRVSYLADEMQGVPVPMDQTIQIGRQAWQTLPPLDVHNRAELVWSPIPTLPEIGLSRFFWSEDGSGARAWWSAGTQEVGGVQARHYVTVVDHREQTATTPSIDAHGSMVERRELWVDPATGRIVKGGGEDEDGVFTIGDITYGLDMSIQPPPADRIVPADAPTAPLTRAP